MHINQLETLPTARLLDLYNDAAERLNQKRVERFADRKTALKRTQRILAEVKAPVVATPKAPEGKKAREPGTAREPRMTFSFAPKAKIKPLREGTKRAAIYNALKKGATFDEVQAVVVEFDKENPPSHPRTPEKLRSFTYEAIRLLHLYSGYGLEQKGDKIYVTGG
jgi:hypothetical protein